MKTRAQNRLEGFWCGSLNKLCVFRLGQNLPENVTSRMSLVCGDRGDAIVPPAENNENVTQH